MLPEVPYSFYRWAMDPFPLSPFWLPFPSLSCSKCHDRLSSELATNLIHLNFTLSWISLIQQILDATNWNLVHLQIMVISKSWSASSEGVKIIDLIYHHSHSYVIELIPSLALTYCINFCKWHQFIIGIASFVNVTSYKWYNYLNYINI